MNTQDIRALLQKSNYDFSELGDGTSALISLDTGKIITLNAIGTEVVSKILNDSLAPLSKEDFILQLATQLAHTFDESANNIEKDVRKFLDGLLGSLS